MKVTDVFVTGVDPAAARAAILGGINSGKLLVNYVGHGFRRSMVGRQPAIRRAKSDIPDSDARRTYIVFGDPLLQLR